MIASVRRSIAFLSFAVFVSLVYGQQPFLTVEPVNELCLGCICEAASGCNTTTICSGETCGLFRITWAYWADAKKPTLKFDTPENPEAYSRCVNDPECAARAVTAYMSRFAQDCNNDGVVNCWDYAAIHKLGGYGCRGNVEPVFYSKFANCQQQVSQVFTGRIQDNSN